MIKETVGRFMLKTKRQFFLEHKTIFEAAIIAFAKILPEPILESDPETPNGKVVVWVNSPVLLRIRDKFLSYCQFKQALYRAAFKIFICILEHDPEHRGAGQFLLEELVESILNGEWQPRERGYPSHHIWLEPRTPEGEYGNFNGRSFKKLIKARVV